MNTHTRSLLIARVVTVIGLLGLFVATGCKSSQSFAVVKFQASTDSSGVAVPGVLARWDGDLFVGWAATYATASVEPKGGGMPFYYVTLPAGRMVVYQRSEKFSWDGEYPSPMPLRAAALFTSAEITQWGLSFSDPVPTLPGDTVPAP